MITGRSFLIAFIFSFSAMVDYSQSIVIDSSAEINVGANSDICASAWGNISGYLTGSGTQCDGALPIELISFEASIQNGRDIFLTWSTIMEINNKGFAIERKPDGKEWTEIGFINSSGNSNIQREYSFTDKKLNNGKYTFRLKQVDYNGFTEYFLLNNYIEIKPPGIFSLSQNYPNPSNPASVIDYQIPFFAKVSIKVYDILGKEVSELVNKTQEAGYYEVKFDGINLASGVYIYLITAEGPNGRLTASKKMLLIK